jgi:L-fuconolactonase
MVVYQRHLPAVIQALDRVPDLCVVIDHIGKPDIAGGDTAGWEKDMAEIARRPLVHCKLSGIVTEADWKAWQPSDIKPYVERVIEWFGFDRLMYGSDWPVCLLATDYGRFWRTLRELLCDIGDENQAKLFGATASSFYGLTHPAARSG